MPLVTRTRYSTDPTMYGLPLNSGVGGLTQAATPTQQSSSSGPSIADILAGYGIQSGVNGALNSLGQQLGMTPTPAAPNTVSTSITPTFPDLSGLLGGSNKLTGTVTIENADEPPTAVSPNYVPPPINPTIDFPDLSGLLGQAPEPQGSVTIENVDEPPTAVSPNYVPPPIAATPNIPNIPDLSSILSGVTPLPQGSVTVENVPDDPAPPNISSAPPAPNAISPDYTPPDIPDLSAIFGSGQTGSVDISAPSLSDFLQNVDVSDAISQIPTNLDFSSLPSIPTIPGIPDFASGLQNVDLSNSIAQLPNDLDFSSMPTVPSMSTPYTIGGVGLGDLGIGSLAAAAALGGNLSDVAKNVALTDALKIGLNGADLGGAVPYAGAISQALQGNVNGAGGSAAATALATAMGVPFAAPIISFVLGNMLSEGDDNAMKAANMRDSQAESKRIADAAYNSTPAWTEEKYNQYMANPESVMGKLAEADWTQPVDPQTLANSYIDTQGLSKYIDNSQLAALGPGATWDDLGNWRMAGLDNLGYVGFARGGLASMRRK